MCPREQAGQPAAGHAGGEPIRHVVQNEIDRDAKIGVCPHQGSSLAIGKDGTYYATWFAVGRKLGDARSQTSRLYVLAEGNTVYLAYKSFDGTTTSIDLMTSRDSGKTWSKPRTVATTEDASDHPLLIANQTTAYLSWLTVKEGYRFIA